MKTIRRALIGTVMVTATAAASAHTGHGTHGFAEGLVHPFGMDHLMTMVAVGVWSAAAMPPGRRALGPVLFLALLAAGAWVGAEGLAVPLLEGAVALSVALFGAMLLAPRAVPPALGLFAVAAAGALHGLAHGAEIPSGVTFGSYAAGFLFTTATLHGLGLFVGQRLIGLHAAAWRCVGAAAGTTGLVLWAVA